jgi:hypothetical protein
LIVLLRFFLSLTLILPLIVWENRLKNDIQNDCLTSVDGTDCTIKGKVLFNGAPDTRYYSYKFQGPALRYEVAVLILSSDIVWVAGPYLPGVWNDLMIFWHGLKGMLLVGERVEADDGYLAEFPLACKCPGALFTRQDQKKMCGRLRRRHETINKRLKIFGCLTIRFRHSAAKHAACFRCAAVLTQLLIKNGEELFDVREYDDRLSDNQVEQLFGL